MRVSDSLRLPLALSLTLLMNGPAYTWFASTDSRSVVLQILLCSGYILFPLFHIYNYAIVCSTNVLSIIFLCVFNGYKKSLEIQKAWFQI